MFQDGPRQVRRAKHDRLAGSHDAGLFGGDGLDVVAEPAAMVERHVGNQAAVRIDRVNGIESPAHTDFQQPCIHPLGVEGHETGERAEFEEGQRDVAAGRLDAL